MGSAYNLDIVDARSIWQAVLVLQAWSKQRQRNFGINLEFTRTDRKHRMFLQRRVGSISISHGHKVLTVDLSPYLTHEPQALPSFLTEFLENQDHVFFGHSVLEAVSHLAFEFDCVIRCVDFAYRSWPQVQKRQNFYAMAQEYLHMGIEAPRRAHPTRPG